MNVAIEEVLAALIDDNDGELTITPEQLSKNRAGMIIAIDFDDERNLVVFTLQDAEDIIYE